MPDSPVCLAPTHMCLDSCWTLSKIRKDEFLLGFTEGFSVCFGLVPFIFSSRTLCTYRLLLSLDTLTAFVHLELTIVAIIVNIRYLLSLCCCYSVDIELHSGLVSS